MKNDLYVIDELNKMNLFYIHNSGEDIQYKKEGNTLFIHPVMNEYQAVLDHLGINPADVSDPDGLEKIILGRMNENILNE